MGNTVSLETEYELSLGCEGPEVVTGGLWPFIEEGRSCWLRADSTCWNLSSASCYALGFLGEIPPCLGAQGKDHQGIRRFQGVERF